MGGLGDERGQEHGSTVGCWIGVIGQCLLDLLVGIFLPLTPHLPIPTSPPVHVHRIKQPSLKLHGGKDSICKPCHMAQLASVCGSDGHTYSSVVRSLGHVWGGGGVSPMPRGTEGPLTDPPSPHKGS